MVIPYTVSYCRGKLAEEDKPSELSSSVEREDFSPPISKSGPPSPSISQQRWPYLASTRLTEVGLKAPVWGFSFRQDRSVDNVHIPPHSIRPQSEWATLTSPGRSASLQECLVWGLNTSTLTPTSSLGLPPAMMMPGTKYWHQLTIIQW